ERGPHRGSAREHVSALYGKYRRIGRTSRLSVRRVLHSQQSYQACQDRPALQTGEMIMDIKEVVKEKYGQAALRVANGGNSCCGASAALNGSYDPITLNLYEASQTTGLPNEAVKASLGCGNPTALAKLNSGETVLDLGSGGGIDVLLSARRVGPAGKAYG